MTVDLTEREVQLLVESLRGNEKHSRKGFHVWLGKNFGRDGWRAKAERADSVFVELVELRAKLGDTKPVEVTKGN